MSKKLIESCENRVVKVLFFVLEILYTEYVITQEEIDSPFLWTLQRIGGHLRSIEVAGNKVSIKRLGYKLQLNSRKAQQKTNFQILGGIYYGKKF